MKTQQTTFRLSNKQTAILLRRELNRCLVMMYDADGSYLGEQWLLSGDLE